MKSLAKSNNLNILSILVLVILSMYATSSRGQDKQRNSILLDALQIERIDSIYSHEEFREFEVYTIYAVNSKGEHYKILSHFDKDCCIADKGKIETGQWYMMPLVSILQGAVARIGGQYLMAPGAAITGTLYYGLSVSIEPNIGIYDLHIAKGLNGLYFSQSNIKAFAFNDNIGGINAETREFHERALCAKIEQSLMEEGVEYRDVEYKFSEDYLERNPNCFAIRIMNYGQPRQKGHSAIEGRLYLIPDGMAGKKADELNAVIKAYMDANPEYPCTYCEAGCDGSLSRILYCDLPYGDDNNSMPSKFNILTESLENGKWAVLLLFTDGELVIPTEYWNLCSVNDENRQEMNNHSLTSEITVFQESDEIFEDIQEMPEFHGGEKGLLNYIRRNLQYPVTAIVNDIQARITVSFVIEKDGSVSNVKSLKFENVYEDGGSKKQTKMLHKLTEKDFADINTELQREAERVVKMMPKWNPGKKGGKTVRVRMGIPVEFLNSH